MGICISRSKDLLFLLEDVCWLVSNEQIRIIPSYNLSNQSLELNGAYLQEFFNKKKGTYSPKVPFCFFLRYLKSG